MITLHTITKAILRGKYCNYVAIVIIHYLLLITNCHVVAQDLHRYSLGFTVSNPSSLTVEFADTISIEFEDNRILLPIEIDGRKYRFIFDTGCTQGAVFDPSPLLGRQGGGSPLQEVGRVAFLDINDHRDTVRVVQLPQFRMGHLVVDGYLCTVVHSGPVTRGYDGIIGFDLVNKGLACKIDVENKRLILTDQKKFFAKEEGYEAKYKLHSFVPYVWVSPFMRHMDCALFDTGFPGFYSMNRESFQKHVYKSKHVAAQVEGRAIGQRTIGAHSVEAADTVYFLALDRLKWGDFSFRDYHCTTQEGSSQIGADILRYGNIIINPFKKRIIFQPRDNSYEVAIANEQHQMSIVPVNGRPTVGLIREESEAYKSGLRRGDVILKINGKDVTSLAAFQQWSFVRGKTYTFTVRDAQGMIKNVQIKK